MQKKRIRDIKKGNMRILHGETEMQSQMVVITYPGSAVKRQLTQPYSQHRNESTAKSQYIRTMILCNVTARKCANSQQDRCSCGHHRDGTTRSRRPK